MKNISTIFQRDLNDLGVCMANIIRDADELEKFSLAIMDFDDCIKIYCDRMESALYSAENSIKDENTKKGIDVLYELLAEVRDITNPMSDMGEAISRSAKRMRRAEEVWL